jgi:putative ABC transport system permease protein
MEVTVEKLFGIPMNQLVVVLLAVFGVGVAVTGLVALRNRVIFRLGTRNVPRRRSQTALIVLGLMLATVLFSAAFAAGDTLTHSIRVLVLRDLGEVDVGVRAENHGANGRHAYFDQGTFDTVRQALVGDPEVEGVAPLVREYAPVVAPDARLSEPWVPILGLAEEWMREFDPLVDGNGNTLSVGALTPDQVYISSELASELEAGQGDTVLLFLGTEPTRLKIAGEYRKGAHPAGKFSLVMPMAQLQTLAGHQGEITEVLVTNRGDAFQGAEHSDVVLATLEPLLEGTGLKAEPWKQDQLAQAEADGNSIATIFFMFAQFSVAAGILLIFLLFVMLAAERKRELGISRAVGTQRGHVVQMFSFEGAVYSLIAAAVGSLLGVAVGLGMVRIMGGAVNQSDFELVFTFRWRSVIIAYTLGMVLTFAVVLFSSWRVSRLNIVRAIRDIPEPAMHRKSLKGLIGAIAVTLIGLLLAFSGYQGEQGGPFGLGISLVIIGVPLVGRRLGLPDRLAFSAAGLGLVVWWLVPMDVFGLPDMEQGIELFFVSGIMLVLGAVWTVMYNSDLLVAALVRLLGRFRGLAPVIKTAVAYPMQNRLRTGITLAMFSLIVFTLTMMGFIITANNSLLDDMEKLSGGYQVRAYANPINPIPNIRAALREAEGVSLDDFEAIASFAWSSTRVKQEGTEQELVDWWIRGHDDGYADSVTYGFALMAEGYDSSREVWQALQDQPGTAVVSSYIVPSRNNFSVGGPDPDFRLEGFFVEDETLPEVTILVQDPRTGNEQRLRVIGVLEGASDFYGAGVMVSQDTLNTLVFEEVQPESYMFRLKEGIDAQAAAKALESSFLEHGLQGVVIADEIRENASANQLMNTLLEGFMGLGLVVGIAALGVIAARSVVERRQQIGILRSLGFQKGMVQLTFLLESSFVALLGIAIGVLLGAFLAYNVIDQVGQEIEGLAYRIPWLNILTVIAISYGASLLTTFLPARQAAKVYPAEALRFE